MLSNALPFKRLLAAACLAVAGWASATPDAPPAAANDPILGLLAERGLLAPIENSALVRSVRDAASELVISALNFLGLPYRHGGHSSETGFDCSGFTRHVFETSVGLVLPRRADEQAVSADLSPVHRGELRPGDLVFFNTMRRTFSHVGIYLGDERFIHAPRSGALVRVESMADSYWAQRFTGARRAQLVAASTTTSPVR